MAIEFQGWPKTPRLFRDSVITEKIDGTNAAVGIKIADWDEASTTTAGKPVYLDHTYVVYAQSRNRLITPDSDNYLFAEWVWDHADYLINDLGPGLHFGEWWGNGIQRGYGLDHKRFSLFNTHKWSDRVFSTENLDTVPIIAGGTFNTETVEKCLDFLAQHGSFASPGFKPAEGVCVYHAASRQVFKATLENDRQPKTLAQNLNEMRLVA